MDVSVEDISTVDGDAEMMNATAARQQRQATMVSADDRSDQGSGAPCRTAQYVPAGNRRHGDNLER